MHSADIRRPLGIPYAPPVSTSRRVADFYKNSNLLIGAKTRIAGIHLVATDTDWTHGSGPEVRGPLLSSNTSNDRPERGFGRSHR